MHVATMLCIMLLAQSIHPKYIDIYDMHRYIFCHFWRILNIKVLHISLEFKDGFILNIYSQTERLFFSFLFLFFFFLMGGRGEGRGGCVCVSKRAFAWHNNEARKGQCCQSCRKEQK
ncbi:hypothetical protein O6H91_10G044100 [Diphasiastrum complanatum]|uniref:Uncharacterized protein n=1 Tax=Diphasiastrum complanatum TaxID=34168 RepID=A0ACC2CGE4_DIPCM|nr:hypothetical protein O6H91_10G044100 [Diphasiastrum complanatum]